MRNISIALVVLIAFAGGVIFFNSGQSKVSGTPATSAPTIASVVVSPTLTASTTAVQTAVTAVPTIAATVAPTPVPTPVPTIPSTAAPTVVATPVPAAESKFTMSGRVTDAVTGEPIAGAIVYVHLPSACPSPGGSGSPTTVTGMATNADGTFRTIGISPGTYLVRANRPGGTGATIRWWNGKQNCQTADSIVLNSDRTGVNFAIPR